LRDTAGCDDAVDLSLIIPFYNPGLAVRSTVQRAAEALEDRGLSFEIIAVSDGSTDESVEALHDVLSGMIRTVVLPVNRGKGFAVRTGFAMARGDWVAFIDADGDIPPEILVPMMERAMATNADIVFGSKRHPESEVSVPVVRRIYSWGYRRLVRRLFHLSVADTQTGVKVLRSEVVAAVLPLVAQERYALDLELFVLADRLGFRTFIEAPVRVEKQYRSTVSLRSVRSILWDTLKIYRRFRSMGAHAPEMSDETRGAQPTS